MSQARWDSVDHYLADVLLPPNAALDAALKANAAAGLPAIDVSPLQGKLLHFLVRQSGARTVLEIGTLGGYSTIWLARALPEAGRLITLEAEPRHADVARSNIARAGLSDRVEVRLGLALDSMAKLKAEGASFDFVFIDADKPNNPNYFRLVLDMVRPGATIIVDNVVRQGAIVDAGNSDPNVRGTRELFELIAKEPRVSATVIQTVGSKGHDGFLMAVVN
ncbi:MAG TPA: O-methyltransferase [Burkholderiales bacterium]|nr:O-methyltransferase [Burkholderiales bacterium]